MLCQFRKTKAKWMGMPTFFILICMGQRLVCHLPRLQAFWNFLSSNPIFSRHNIKKTSLSLLLFTFRTGTLICFTLWTEVSKIIIKILYLFIYCLLLFFRITHWPTFLLPFSIFSFQRSSSLWIYQQSFYHPGWLWVEKAELQSVWKAGWQTEYRRLGS